MAVKADWGSKRRRKKTKAKQKLCQTELKLITNLHTDEHSGTGVAALSAAALDARARQHIWTRQHYLSAPI